MNDEATSSADKTKANQVLPQRGWSSELSDSGKWSLSLCCVQRKAKDIRRAGLSRSGCRGCSPSVTENRQLGPRGPSSHPCQEPPPSTAGCLVMACESNQATRREANDKIWKQTHLPGTRRSGSCERSRWRREIFVGSNHHLDTIDGPSEGRLLLWFF